MSEDKQDPVASRRAKQYKNASRHEEARRRRAEHSVELRKAQKDEYLMKRRNIVVDNDDEGEVTDDSIVTGSADEKAQATAERKPQDAHSMMRMSLQQVMELVNTTPNPTRDQLLAVTTSIRRLLSSDKNAPIQQVLDNGLAQMLLNILVQVDDNAIRFETLWALTNILSGDSGPTKMLVEWGIVPHLICNSQSQQTDVAEQAVWALANIVGDCAELRDVCLQNGLLAALKTLLMPERYHQLPNQFRGLLAWTISNVVRHKSSPIAQETLIEVLSMMPIVMSDDDETALRDVFWAISYMSDQGNGFVATLVESGIVVPLVESLRTPRPGLLGPALRALGNFVAGNDSQCQAVIDAGILDVSELRDTYDSLSNNVKKEIMWLLSNIAAGNAEQQQALLNSNWLPNVTYELEHGENRTRLEASFVIANLTNSKDYSQCVQLLCRAPDTLSACATLLEYGDTRVLINILDTLMALFDALAGVDGVDIATGQATTESYEQAHAMFEEAGGVDKLEQVQLSEAREVYDRAIALIDAHFNDDEENSEAIGNQENQAPKTDGEEQTAPQQMFNF